MKIFKSGAYAWWQVGLLKFSLLFIGITIGSNWPEMFVKYTAHLLTVAIVLGVYLAYVWVKQG